jgi:hypothetical protein
LRACGSGCVRVAAHTQGHLRLLASSGTCGDAADAAGYPALASLCLRACGTCRRCSGRGSDRGRTPIDAAGCSLPEIKYGFRLLVSLIIELGSSSAVTTWNAGYSGSHNAKMHDHFIAAGHEMTKPDSYSESESVTVLPAGSGRCLGPGPPKESL